MSHSASSRLTAGSGSNHEPSACCREINSRCQRPTIGPSDSHGIDPGEAVGKENSARNEEKTACILTLAEIIHRADDRVR